MMYMQGHFQPELAACASGSGWSRGRDSLEAGFSLFRDEAAYRVDILAVHVPELFARPTLDDGAERLGRVGDDADVLADFEAKQAHVLLPSSHPLPT
jgi:hypothetical protein